TEPGSIIGTPRYMSPEQHGGGVVDPRSDQFAFAASLYGALFRRPAFPGTHLADVRANVLSGRPQPIPRGSGVPRWLQRVILRGLASEPAARYPSLNAMLVALSRDKRRRFRLLAAGLAVAGGGALAAVLLSRGAEDPCQGAGAHLAGVWDESVKKVAGAAFAASGRVYAADSFARAAPLLDAYAASWVATRT